MKLKLLLAVAIAVAPYSVNAEQTPRGTATIGATLNEARLKYDNETNSPRKDCDPVGDGRWICASYNNPRLADFGTTVPNTENGTVAFNPSENPSAEWADSYSVGNECYIDSTFDHGIGGVLVATPQGQKTVREVAEALGAGPGKSGNPIYNDVQCGNGPANNNGDEDIGRCPGRVDQGGAACGIIGPKWNLPRAFPNNDVASATYQDGDLLAVHWDAAPDYDDLQAMIATRIFLDANPDVDFMVVVGTTNRAVSSFLNGADAHMLSMFPDGIVTRKSQWNNDAQTIANKWEQVLNAGKTVHVAEGGPSDFTGRVIDVLLSRGVSGLKRIQIVQHSASANERTTETSVINKLRNLTTYVNIQDGNGPNETPAYNGKFTSLATRNDFKARSLDSEYGSQWATAYSYVIPQTSPRVVDFSDFVEVLHIMGVPTSQLPDIKTFADTYFVDTPVDPVDPVDPVEPPVTVPPTHSDGVAKYGTNLLAARAAYAAATDKKRVDCDPVAGGWVCASFNNPTLADITTDHAGPTTPVVDGQVAVIGNNLGAAKSGYDSATGAKRVDCDPVGDGRWICANFNNPKLSDVTGESSGGGSDNGGGSTGGDVNLGNGDIPSDALFSLGDLISVQYDSCPDPDDLHAAVAGRMVLDFYGLERDKDYIVVNGTCGFDRPHSNYISQSPQVFNKLYGTEGTTTGWLNAFEQNGSNASKVNKFRTNAIERAATKWRVALEAGRKVWVLDGGPMDFTYSVIRELEQGGFNGNYKNIKVIQHSHGWNEDNTNDSNLNYMRNRADYVKIDNGNASNNRTADLNDTISGAADNALINRIRSNDEYGDEWAVSFNLLNPNSKFDGSDTVEMLWILGIQSNDVANWFEFMDAFLPENNNSGGGTGGGQTGSGSALLKIQAEDGVNFSGSGWSTESALSGSEDGSYIIWRGANDFRADDNDPPAGIKAYDFTVTEAGTYKFLARVQSRVGANGASDSDNDGWVKFTSGNDVQLSSGVLGQADKWTKFFQGGATKAWGQYSNGEQYNPTFKTSIVRFLPAGTHRILVGGRSTRFAIDWVGIQKQ